MITLGPEDPTEQRIAALAVELEACAAVLAALTPLLPPSAGEWEHTHA